MFGNCFGIFCNNEWMYVYLFVIILTPVLTLQRAFFNYDLNIKKIFKDVRVQLIILIIMSN